MDEQLHDAHMLRVPPTPYADEFQFQWNFVCLAVGLHLPDARAVAALRAGGQAAEDYLRDVRRYLQMHADGTCGQPGYDHAWLEAQIEAHVAWLRYAGHLLREHPKAKVPPLKRLHDFVRLIRDSDWRPPAAPLRRLMGLGRLQLACYPRRGRIATRQAEDELQEACSAAYDRQLLRSPVQVATGGAAVPEGAGAAGTGKAAATTKASAKNTKRPQADWWGRWRRDVHRSWTDVEVRFLLPSVVSVGGVDGTFKDAGFEKGGKMAGQWTLGWVLLQVMAHIAGRDAKDVLLPDPGLSRVHEQVKLLRWHLSKLTGLPGDPLPRNRRNNRGTEGWEPRFRVRDLTNDGMGGGLDIPDLWRMLMGRPDTKRALATGRALRERHPARVAVREPKDSDTADGGRPTSEPYYDPSDGPEGQEQQYAPHELDRLQNDDH